MNFKLLLQPWLLMERLGQRAVNRRRLRRLHGTAAGRLELCHVDSLELLDLMRADPPRVIYDIGANVGTWTLLAKTIFPESVIHAFEPLRTHAADYVRATESLQNLHLHQVALGRSKGEAAMQVTSFSDASSLLQPAAKLAEHYKINKVGEEHVVVERLDDYVANKSLPPPDLIKLDIQGYELEALAGGPLMLQSTKYILTEVSFEKYYENQCLFEDVVGFLAERKFRVHAFGTSIPGGHKLSQADVLFERIS